MVGQRGRGADLHFRGDRPTTRGHRVDPRQHRPLTLVVEDRVEVELAAQRQDLAVAEAAVQRDDAVRLHAVAALEQRRGAQDRQLLGP